MDWYGPKADPVYWRREGGGGWGGGGGGGVVVAGLQVACEARIQRGKVLGHPPRKKWEFRPSYTDYIPGTSDFLCSSHCQGIVTSYLPSTPISLSCLCNSSCAITVYKVHYCIIIKHARSLNNSQTFHRIIRITLIYMLGHKKIQETSKLKMFLNISRD